MCDIDSQNGEDAALSVTKQYGEDRAIFIKTDVTKQQDVEGQLNTRLNMFLLFISTLSLCAHIKNEILDCIPFISLNLPRHRRNMASEISESVLEKRFNYTNRSSFLFLLILILRLLLWLYSPCGPWPLFQFPSRYTVGRTPRTSDELVARPLPTYGS
jgi:hypothetical protein